MLIREQHYYKILSTVKEEKRVTQRAISDDLGIALGLTNLLIKRLVKKGFLNTVRAVRGGRLHYLLTPQGLIEQTRLSRVYVENSVRLYAETRERIRGHLEEIAASRGRKRMVFYGAGEVAEIAYVVLSKSDLELVGVVDDGRRGKRFFGHKIEAPESLAKRKDWDMVLLTETSGLEEARARLWSLRVPEDRIAFAIRPFRES